MKYLFITFLGIATLGSVYPFDFEPASIDADTMHAFLHSCCVLTGRGDIIANIILFVPFGFLGMLTMRPRSASIHRFTFMLITGAVFATFLQVLQIFLPSRDESLQDVLWNLIGMLLGGAVAVAAGQKFSTATARPLKVEIAPAVLIASWLVYKLLPFVPSIDLQLFKESVSPLFQPELVPASILHDVTAWLVVGYLLRCLREDLRLDGALPLLISAVFFLEIIIIDNTLTASNVVGGFLAITIWLVMGLARIKQEALLIILLLSTIAVSGLTPLVASQDPGAFNWMPFYGFLGGSMYLNALSAAEKVFLYGSTVFILRAFAVNRILSVVLVLCAVFMIELAQTQLEGHTPEITDPILVILAAGALLALERQYPTSPPRFAIREDAWRGFSENRRRRKARSADPGATWVKQPVHLHRNQLEFLESLSREMNTSLSGVIRQIVKNVMDENRLTSVESVRDPNAKSWAEISYGDASSSPRASHRNAWSRVSVKLQRSQVDILGNVARTFGISVSRLIRRIVCHFIDKLGQEQSLSTAPSPGSSGPSDPAPP